MIQRTSLSIKLFAECNMSCSYCIQRTQKQYPCIDLREPLQRHLAKYNYEFVSIMGGEPLLIPEYVTRLVKIINEMTPETRVTVITNGTQLSPGLVDFFNEKCVKITLSTNSVNGGEKSLAEISSKAAAGPKVIGHLKEIDRLDIRKIVTLDEGEFATETAMLKEVFSPLRIHVSPDYTTLDEFGAKHLMNFEVSLDKLYRWYAGDLSWLFLSGTNRNCCDCSESHVMNADGSMTTLADVQGNHNIVEGCSLFENSMGKENYALYRKILNRYFAV
ncbi:radical SAM protein [Desulfoluna butyratoxydans]|uniref:Radical sam n=1 Tax=Desulfoluna butyratoxydans TaxID=231438 RepID=A0A4U8YL27_9BACT|nr:radical SAM protein [Desulfoluna butyratoxydans]VFQ43849.1 radical sam [Desulfoluna butyratoxydans]